jgi:uncharacterized membrane protein (GlpM family)
MMKMMMMMMMMKKIYHNNIMYLINTNRIITYYYIASRYGIDTIRASIRYGNESKPWHAMIWHDMIRYLPINNEGILLKPETASNSPSY